MQLELRPLLLLMLLGAGLAGAETPVAVDGGFERGEPPSAESHQPDSDTRTLPDDGFESTSAADAPPAEPAVPETIELTMPAGATETPASVTDTIQAADVLEPSLLSGPGYTIAPDVQLSGYMMQFTIESDHGTWIAESRELVPVRIEEVDALQRLKNAGHSEAAWSTAKRKAYETFDGLKRVVTRPIDTAKALPKGVERLIKRRVGEVKKAVSRARDDAVDEMADAKPDAAGPFDAGRKPAPAMTRKEKNIERGKKQGFKLFKRRVGFKDARNQIALHLGVDPYSDNPVLAAELDRMAWSSTGSAKAFDLALDALGAATWGVLPELLRIDDTAWRLDEESLAENNRLRLNALGCTDEFSRRFVRKGSFTPTFETAFVVGLEQMQITGGCDEALELANSARNQVEARFVVNGIRQLLAAPLPGTSGVPKDACHLRLLGAGFGADCGDEIYVPVPVDRLSWDDDIATFLDADTVRSQQRTILLLGTATREARAELTERGFAIIEKSPLE